MNIFCQQNQKSVFSLKAFIQKVFKENLNVFPYQKMQILFNKCPFLSLILATGLFTFVSYLNIRKKHLPMTKLKITFQQFPKQPWLLRHLPLLAGMVAFCLQLNAQGWEIYFGGNSDDIGQDIIQTQDWGFAATGFSQSFGADGDYDVYVIRTDVDGKLIWSKIYDEGFIEHGYSIIETPDKGLVVSGDIRPTQLTKSNAYLIRLDKNGVLLWSRQFGNANEDEQAFKVIATSNSPGYLLVGRTTNSTTGQSDVLLVKTDELGNQVWLKTLGGAGDDVGRSVTELADGYLVAGSSLNAANNTTDLYLVKTDFSGNEVWSKYFGAANDIDEGYDLVKTTDGNIAVVGYTGSNSDVYLLKTTVAGDEIWSKTFDGDFGGTDQGYGLLETGNEDLVITGNTEISFFNIDALLAKTDKNGNLIWWRSLGRNSHVDEGAAVVETKKEGFIVVGYNSLFGNLLNDVSFFKTGPDGLIYTNHLSGKIYVDNNQNCTLQAGEQGLNNWIIRAASPTKTFFGTTDENGNYDIFIDTGVYQVTALVKNQYWQSCIGSYNVNYSSQYDTLSGKDFPMWKLVDCPLLTVDVSAPVIQNCSNIGYTVSYCNDGTSPADVPSVHIILDNSLTLTGSSVPVADQVDSLYIFNIATLDIDECGSFNFTVSSDCNGQPFEAYSVSAHIFPDTLCVPVSPSWDMSSIKADGYCDSNNDSIRFTLRNIGSGNMNEPQAFIVIEDQVMLTQDPVPYQLESAEDTTITIAATGATYRIIAEQSPNHPGNSYPTVAVEGCSNTGNYSTGYVTQLQEDENDPFVSVDVQEAISPSDYIMLRGYPRGYQVGGENLIPANTSIEYHLYFQNAGTDTIQRLVIRDTLPASLDLATVVPGASSHPYNFEVYSNGVLKFTFEDLNLLPDGDTASQGFVKFKVAQKPDNPEGTIIPNSAAVFLGYDAPAQTETYTHVVGGAKLLDFVLTDVEEPEIPGVGVSAYPNPFATAIEFEVNGRSFNALNLSVFNIKGQPVRQQQSSGSHLRFQRNGLPAGTYAYRLEGDGLLLQAGKFVVR